MPTPYYGEASFPTILPLNPSSYPLTQSLPLNPGTFALNPQAGFLSYTSASPLFPMAPNFPEQFITNAWQAPQDPEEDGGEDSGEEESSYHEDH